MFGIAGTVELGTICPGTGTWNRLQDGTMTGCLRQLTKGRKFWPMSKQMQKQLTRYVPVGQLTVVNSSPVLARVLVAVTVAAAARQ